MERSKSVAFARRHLPQGPDVLLFDPQKYDGRQEELTIERQKLTRNKLLEYASLTDYLRQRFKNEAMKLVTRDPDILENLGDRWEKIPVKLQRRFLKP